MTDAPSVACTLTPAGYNERIASIRALTRDALLRHDRRDLTLELFYASAALERVRDMIRKEQACCSFLSFDLHLEPGQVRVTIIAPEAAREVADPLFQEFAAGEPASAGCGCGAQAASAEVPKHHGSTSAGVTAVALTSSGVVACGACCLLPVALPAAVLGGTGGILALLASVHSSLTTLGVFAVVGAWIWIGWQTMRSRLLPSIVTLVVVGVATMLAAVAAFWPSIEPHILDAL
jgi:hypothetical protein